ncbi:hypothetical protein NADFUDRAFT_7921, partial [Nadsonia fulvescens var. elongata DSM 6958]
DSACFICAEPIQYLSVTPCNHTCCHKCSLRMRALYKNKSCPHCRAEQDFVIFSKDLTKTNYEDYKPSSMTLEDNRWGIKFDSEETKVATFNLMKFNCPDAGCETVVLSWKELKNHVRTAHSRNLCDLCCNHKKVFTVELKLYTFKGLHRHESTGDETGFKGHPACDFCRTRFYSSDELFTHIREQHERCFICEREGFANPPIFRDYTHLEQHFKSDHFICNAQSCLDKKFVVFANKIDLQAHLVSEHPSLYGNSKSARTIETGFTQTRDNNANNRRREFDSRQKRLEERARNYLNYSVSKFEVFYAILTKFRKNEITAKILIRDYVKLFQDTNKKDFELLVNNLADLYDKNKKKRESILDAFTEWKRKQEFSTLTGAGPSPGVSVARGAPARTNFSNPASVPSAIWAGNGTKKTTKNDFPSLPGRAPAKFPPVKAKSQSVKSTASSPFGSPLPSRTSSSTNLDYFDRPLTNSSSPASGSASPVFGTTKSKSTSDFPSLPIGKKAPPRVNPVSPSNNNLWGDSLISTTQYEDPNDIEVVVGKKGKKK